MSNLKEDYYSDNSGKRWHRRFRKNIIIPIIKGLIFGAIAVVLYGLYLTNRGG